LLFSAVISEHFSKHSVIMTVVAAEIWYLKKCAVFIGPPCRVNVDVCLSVGGLSCYYISLWVLPL